MQWLRPQSRLVKGEITMELLTLPNSGVQLTDAELLSIEAVGRIEALEFDHFMFTLYVRDPAGDKAFVERHVTNESKLAAQKDILFIMSHHPKL